MVDAKPGIHQLQLKPVIIPAYMITGEKFIRWDEEGTATKDAVTLKVDESGFYLYWTNLNQDVDLIDVSTIRDTRTGKGAKVPRDPKIRQSINYGSTQDTLEDKTLTVVSGPDFVNLTFTNFCTEKKETAKMWCDDLLKIANNLLQLNNPIMPFLRKIHMKLSILTDKQGKIPIKNITKTFTQNKDDRKRVEKALDAAGIPAGKNEAVSPSKFTFDDFFVFYRNLTVRTEVERVFDQFSGNSKKKVMTAEQFMEFINKEQRDPRLNEILYPYTTTEKARELIECYEPNSMHRSKSLLSVEGFLRYILSEDNAIVAPEKYDLSDDMDQPLGHYFINSSHNTYLTGHQLTGRSSVEMYRQCLLAGCRCVELDFWNGKTEEPVIVHGYTLVPDIPAKDVIQAIAESAFKTSDYPVILSFENHCNTKQQSKIAQYCREFFGSMLLEIPIDSHPLEAGVPLPPPSMLKRKIIIKNKKKHHHHHHSSQKQKPVKKMSKSAPPENGESSPSLLKEDSKESVEIEETSLVAAAEIPEEYVSSSSDDEDDSTEPDNLSNLDKSQSDKGTAGKESEAGAEISALVNYVQPVHFYSFENSLNRNKSYEMSSFDEKQAMTLLKERPVEFVNYNKHQLSRVYPRGTRVDSANFMPQLFWNAGCQLVALNYQTLDLAMQLNLGIFELNHRCGYLLKPEFMRRKDRKFDPFAESTVDGIIAGTVSIQVISGQFLTDKRVGTYVEVEMYGLPTDTVRKRFRTKIVPANGINPLYDEDPFVFKKVVLPELACIRIVACEDSGKPIGHRVVPVVGLRPGYRHVVLRNESGQPLNLPTLFIHIKVKDYVPDALSELAEALANPIKYQNELDKRARQLSVLQDDTIAEDLSSNEEFSIQSERTPSHSSEPPRLVGGSIRRPKLPDTSIGNPACSPPLGASPVERGFGSTGGLPSHPPQLTKPESIDDGKKAVVGPMPAPPPVLAAYGESGNAPVKFMAEPLDKFLENKVFRDKKAQLEKKLDEVKKKHEKERKLSKLPKSHKSLVKKLSSKHLDMMIPSKDPIPPESLVREQLSVEKDTFKKGQEEIFKSLEKMVRESQTKQMKSLASMEEKEVAEVMKWVYNWRKDEHRRLSKQTRDKNELDRMKREVNSVLVNKGVVEREKKERLYKDIKYHLESAHAAVIKKLEEEKRKTLEGIEKDFEEKLNHVLLSHGSMDEVSLSGVESASSSDIRASFSKQ